MNPDVIKETCQLPGTTTPRSGITKRPLGAIKVLMLFAVLLLAIGRPQLGFSMTSSPKVVFAHMVNTRAAVDWGLAQGANAVEMDIRFTPAGVPEKFRHSHEVTQACDCFHPTSSDDHVCSHLGPLPPLANLNKCFAETDAVVMLNYLATKSIAVVYMDSKVDSSSDAPAKLDVAGTNIIDFLDTNLFGKGYKGQVIVSTPAIKYEAYTKAAIARANNSRNKAHYFFTFDGQSSGVNLAPSSVNQATDFGTTMQHLKDAGTSNRVYATGLTALLPATFYDQITISAYNKKQGIIASTGIWTIDDPDAMSQYLDVGVDSIMSNKPGVAVALIKRLGGTLAAPGEALQVPKDGTAQVHLTLPAGEICQSNANCSQAACGRGTAADNAHKICCASGKTSTYGGYDYCTGMPDASACWSNAQCLSDYCRGNNSGTNKGTCGKLEINLACQSNSDCKGGACGRATADDQAGRLCCPSGKTSTYAGFDYCTGMPSGTRCWSDAMCNSGDCKGNASGIKIGRCK
jgi:glycerophosphoryl diester phosphodiesterase